jgi:SAM-dependent methyltransferase
MTVLSERQRRELEFYEEFSKMHAPETYFASISGKETRPWNSYWKVVEIVQQNFRSEDQKLLDFGCGKGELSLVFSKIGYEVFGFDLSPNNIAIAKRLASEYKMAGRTHFRSVWRRNWTIQLIFLTYSSAVKSFITLKSVTHSQNAQEYLRTEGWRYFMSRCEFRSWMF